MANLATPNGLQVLNNSALGPTKVTAYYISSSQAAMAVGTPVKGTGTSNSSSVIYGKEWPAGTLQGIAVATGGDANAILGSIVSFEQNPTNLLPTTGSINAANTEGVAYVADDINQEFAIIDDGNALAVTDIGLNANLTIGTVNSFTGIDSTSLDTSTPNTNATYQLKILRLLDAPNNQISQANAAYVVKINNHELANVTAGV